MITYQVKTHLGADDERIAKPDIPFVAHCIA